MTSQAGTDESLPLSAVDELPSREDRLASALGSIDNTLDELSRQDKPWKDPTIGASVDDDLDPVSIRNEIAPVSKESHREGLFGASVYSSEPNNMMAV